jgi:ABC-type glycerol-3-phosphate transport system substrate-binding protein
MRAAEGSAPLSRMSRRLRRTVLTSLAVSGAAMAVAACGSSGDSNSNSASSPTTQSGTPAEASGDITVWVDSVRLPAAKEYVKTHPDVNVKIVTYDGDANGAATLQTKIQLWNRTGKGWPDVIFSQQVNDPVWMAKPPFDFAQPVKGLIPDDKLSKWPAPSTAQCTIDGTQYCVQDNIAQVVLWVNEELMDKFNYEVPKTWQEWAALGQKVAQEHPGYIVGNIGDSFSHWIYLWGDQCPLQQLRDDNKLLIDSADDHCTRMAGLLDPLIENGTLPPLSVFTPDFANKYGGKDGKVLLMPGPAWYATSLFRDTLHIPAKQMTAAMPLQWENESPITTGQVGGGPWIISRHSKNLPAAADFVTWATTSHWQDHAPGYPAYEPEAVRWLGHLAKEPYFASDPTPALKAAAPLIWQGWNLVSYPDQPVWSNTVVTKLVAGDSLSSLLQPLGDGLAQAAQAAGYEVERG